MGTPATIEIAAVLFLASAIRSSLGFGEALVAVPLMALVLPVEVAAPLAVLASITIALIVVVQDWKHVQVRSAAWLVISTVAGIPLGLLMLKTVPETVVKIILGLIIIGFSLQSLLGRSYRSLANDTYSWAFGFVAGILGGAYGMNGPPLAMYGSLRGWSPKHFRATLQGYFLPASALGMFGYGLTGLWTSQVNRLFLWSLPLVVAATFLGRWLHHRLDERRFRFAVNAGLVGIGMILLAQALVGSRG
jgi:uncharacterized membrane protein YfcA